MMADTRHNDRTSHDVWNDMLHTFQNPIIPHAQVHMVALCKQEYYNKLPSSIGNISN